MIKRRQSSLENMNVTVHQFLLLINSFEATEIYNLTKEEYPKTIDEQLKSEIVSAVTQLNSDLESGLLKCRATVVRSLLSPDSSYRFIDLLSAFYNDYDFDWSNSPPHINLFIENFNIIVSEGFSFDLFQRISLALSRAYVKFAIYNSENSSLYNPYNWPDENLETLKELKETASAELISTNSVLFQKNIVLEKEKADIEDERIELMIQCALHEEAKNNEMKNKIDDASSLKVIGALIDLVEKVTNKRFNQTRVVTTLEASKIRGFSESSLQKLFAKSKKAFKESKMQD
jgi:hypothetical protein